MASLAAIPHGKDQAQGRKEYLPLALSPWQGKNHSLIKQMSLLILPDVCQLCGSLMQRHLQPAPAARSCEESEKSPYPGPVPSS